MASPTFSQEIADKICVRLADGESLRSICIDEGMPTKTTVFRWLLDDRYTEFRDQYARAREAQADSLVDEMLDIADDATNDWMERRDDEGGNLGWKENGDAIQRSKLRIDARKWMAGKLQPKKYGDAVQLKHADADGEKLQVDPATAAVRIAGLIHGALARDADGDA